MDKPSDPQTSQPTWTEFKPGQIATFVASVVAVLCYIASALMIWESLRGIGSIYTDTRPEPMSYPMGAFLAFISGIQRDAPRVIR
jgi:hypothetical protein